MRLDQASGLYVGGTLASAAYLGSTLVWSGMTEQQLSRSIASTVDDGSWSSGNWSQNAISVGNIWGFILVTGGFRFTNLSIPQGAPITNATMTFNYSTGDGATVPAAGLVIGRIRVLDVDNGPTLSTSPMTPLAQDENVVASGASSQTVDVTSGVQAVVNRAGWSSGNSINLFIDPTGSQVSGSGVNIYDYSNSPTLAAKLNITYMA